VLQKLDTINALKPTGSNIYEVPNIFAVDCCFFFSYVPHRYDMYWFWLQFMDVNLASHNSRIGHNQG